MGRSFRAFTSSTEGADDKAMVDVQTVFISHDVMIDGSVVRYLDLTKLFHMTCDRLYAFDVLRSRHSVPNIFEKNTGNLTHQYEFSSDNIVIPRAPRKNVWDRNFCVVLHYASMSGLSSMCDH